MKGVPLDRIFLRPRWLVPWKKDRSIYPSEVQEIEGRPLSPRRRRVAVLSPYFPFPLAHGGAVRIFNLLREMSGEFDIFLFAFSDRETADDLQPVLDLCARVILVDKPRYREPRWSTLAPPEVHEFRSPAMAARAGSHPRRIQDRGRASGIHHARAVSLATCWWSTTSPLRCTGRFATARPASPSAGIYWRWQRFEKKWIRRYRKVVVMSEQDRALLARPNVAVIPNGVDLARFTPEIERPGQRLLFIGSFRHFPNIVAYRFFVEQVWPILRETFCRKSRSQ